MGPYALTAIGLIILGYFLLGWDKVSKLHYALVFIFGRHGPQSQNGPYWGWTKKEGWVWIPPLVGDKTEYPVQFNPFRVQISIQTKEEDAEDVKDQSSVPVTFALSGTRRPDYSHLNRYRKWDEAFEKDLKERLSDKLQGVAGQYTVIELIVLHSNVGRYLNALTRLSEEKMPHLHGIEYGETQDVIPENEILDFYKKNAARIDELLNSEFDDPNPSYIEEYYGCDFGKFNLSPPELSAEAKRAFAARTEANQRIKAIQAKSDAVEQLMDAHGKTGLEISRAFSEVNQSLGTPMEIIVVEERGSGGNKHLWLNRQNRKGDK